MHTGKPEGKQKRVLVGFLKKEAQKSANVKQYQFWRHDNKPIELWSNKVIRQKITDTAVLLIMQDKMGLLMM